jgi:class 3 adenylate cyclase
MPTTPDMRPTRMAGIGIRISVWVGHMALPLLALWLLIAQPDLDVQWEHHPSHFWLVMGVAAVNVGLSVQVLRAARLREDARLLLVGYAFMLAAGFLFLHALATPGVIVGQSNSGFEVATPVGLALASVFFTIAGVDYSAEASNRLVGRDPAVRWTIVGVMVLWGVVSVAQLPPLTRPLPEQAVGPLRWMAAVSIALYVVAAVRFFISHRKKPSVMLIALITSAVLLAEAMATIVWAARNWHLSWWLWHLLMAAAFGFVAYSAYTQYRREGASAGIFDGIVTRQTGEAIRQEYGGALETLTDTFQRSVQVGLTDQDVDLIIAGLGTRFALTEGQTELLARAARSLATERDQARRLGALAVIATGTWVERSEDELLEEVIEVVADRFTPDVMRVGVMGSPGAITFSDRLSTAPWPQEGDRYSVELTVGGEHSGIVEFARPTGQFRSQDFVIMDTLVAEIGIAMENTRLYRQLDTLFRTYLSPDVAETLKADPSQAGLGGSIAQVTAMFADLRGFTTFSERTEPGEVTELLNRYFGVAVPIVLRNGGTVVQFVGDAMLAVFDAPTPRSDHEFRAARTALEMQEAIGRAAGDGPDTPRFRIGVNTGPALIGNIGSAELRSFNVVGDAVNVASRLETSAEPGSVFIGETTYKAIADRVEAIELGPLELKGKDLPVIAYRLERIIGG